MNFAGGHVFTYSARPGTAAARMPDQVPHRIRKQHSAEFRALLTDSAQDYRARFLGRTLPVLWESATALGPEYWKLNGLTDNYLRVKAEAPRQLWNQITPVRLKKMDGSDMLGAISS
jgi:threonylcarbamoyladenosine tRNA methylthiotransferase MtaB